MTHASDSNTDHKDFNIDADNATLHGSRRLRGIGLTLCALAILTAGHVVISMVKSFNGDPVLVPELLLHIEAGIAGAAAVGGLCMLVAGAEPFDESEEPPLLKYEKQERAGL